MSVIDCYLQYGPMGTEPHLSPENILLLEQAARCADSLAHYCFTGISSAEERDSTATDVAGTVSDAIHRCTRHIARILTEPSLQPWMDRNDRADLADLSQDLQHELSELNQPSSNKDPFDRLHAFFANVHSDGGTANLLIRATRGSLRNRMPEQPIYKPEPLEKSRIHIRWMILRDLPEVLAIDEEGFKYPWPEKVLRHNVVSRHRIGMVAEVEDRVVGFMIYELHDGLIHMVRFAVQESERRKGIGTDMVKKLVMKLHEHRRRRLLLPVPDRNLFSSPPFYAKRQLHAVAAVPSDDEEESHLLEHRVGLAPAVLTIPRPAATRPSFGSFLPVQKWDPTDIPQWDPKTLKDRDPYGLWSDGEEDED